MTPHQYCQQKVLHDGSSLHYSLRFLPASQRQVLTALYAFYQEVSEVCYECRDMAVGQVKLKWWQEEVANTFAGTPQHPVGQALTEAIHRHQLLQHYFQEIIEGKLKDLSISRYNSFEQLEQYCQCTSGVLSLLCTQVLGYQHNSTLKYAEQLGIALQLSYLLREICRDLQHGRLYIPQEDLTRFNVGEQTLFNGQLLETVQALFAYQATRIRAYYYNAFKYLAKEDRFSQRSGLIRAQLALATLQEIENEGYQLFKYPTRLTAVRKLWITLHTLGQAKGWLRYQLEK
jgi:phytoene synthase